MKGKIYGIGVGPGDPELMTLKAVRILKACEVVGIPAKDVMSCTAYQIALRAVPEIAQKRVAAVSVPMTTDQERLNAAYDEGVLVLKRHLEAGENIAFVNLGDPTIYASYMEIHQRMISAGYEAELISGVPAFCAVAAALGVGLGSGKESIHILPGKYHTEDLEQYSGTRILMKSGGKNGMLKNRLAELEAAGKVSVQAVANCGLENQVIYHDIQELDGQAGYFTTILVKDREEN